MKEIYTKIKEKTLEWVSEKTDKTIQPGAIQLQQTRKEFEGDITLVTFPFAKFGLGNPVKIGEELGEYLKENISPIESFNVIKGFLNIQLKGEYWAEQLKEISTDSFLRNDFGKDETVVVEFSSPNTNKPLHLGHLRNIFLGDSVCNILEANGYKVHRTCLVNDRGIAICKSMLMYQKYGNGATPESSGKKPDHFVVESYVRFATEYEKQVNELVSNGLEEEEAKEKAPVMQEAREMLRKWEAGDPETIALWKQMNNWVYEGFDETYKRIRVSFDKVYYESETYLEGTKLVESGLRQEIFFQKPDGSVWIDLSSEGLDEKVLRRADGTSLYITQDMGTALAKYEDYQMDKSVYVVGNEQDYHFKVLVSILQKLDPVYAKGLYHLSYGMVDLPTGKMKTRTGTTVDADHLIDDVVQEARLATEELGKTESLTQQEQVELHEAIALAAVKYYLLKVQPKKRMLFNPAESVDLHGDTGPYIQYAYARTKQVNAKAKTPEAAATYTALEPQERALLRHLVNYPVKLKEAADKYDPSIIADYTYELTKLYNRFYHDLPILTASSPEIVAFRLRLSDLAGETLKFCLGLLGIDAPEKM